MTDNTQQTAWYQIDMIEPVCTECYWDILNSGYGSGEFVMLQI